MQHTIVIEAPVERVWALTIDLEQWPSITPTVTEVQLIDRGPVGAGTRARVAQPGFPAGVWVVEEVAAPHRFVWSRTMAGLRLVATHELERLGAERCRQTLSIELDGGLASIAGLLLRAPITEALSRENAGFAAAAASRDGPPS